MKKMVLIVFGLMFLTSLVWGQTALSTGDIAFTAFNADGDDDFAIVALVDIPSGTTLYFSDNEPNADGTGFVDFGEGTLQWETGESDIIAGTIIVFTDTDAGSNANFGASTGTLSIASFDSGMNLSGGGDALYAVEGSPDGNNISVWLAGIQNEANNQGANFDQTGLTTGSTFIEFYPSYSPDGGYYSGLRSGQASFANYLTLLGNNTNWTTESSNGELILPISTTAFSVGGNIPPIIENIVHSPSSDITSSTTVSVSVDVTDSDGSLTNVELHWGTTSGSLTNTINMSILERASYTTDSNIPVQADGVTVYYEIQATDDEPESTTSSEQSYTVFDAQSTILPYTEVFAADLGQCYTSSVTGDTKVWVWNASEYAYMSGYDSGVTEEDWLILPSINFDNYSDELMSFDTWYNFGSDDENNYLKLYYSPDYAGIGDPNSSTWTELTFSTPTASTTWTTSGNIDLSAITGTSVYIGFKYNYEAGSYRNWGVDNISIQEVSTPTITLISPNGGESWEQGSTQEITWSTEIYTSNAAVTIKAYYNYDTPTDEHLTYIITESAILNSGSYSWSIPADMTVADDYIINISIIEDDIDATDESDLAFSIIAPIVAPDFVIINEVDADTPGTDADEFIELYDGGIGNTALDGLVVVLYNGSDDQSYLPAVDLDGYTTDADGYFVLGSASVANVDLVIGTTNIIQNGADAVALYEGNEEDFPNDTPITTTNLFDAIVYDTNDGDDAGLLVLLNADQPQVNEGENGSNDVESCQRIPNGSGGARNTYTYSANTPTPGAANAISNLDTPTNVVISHNGTNVSITWDAVTGANSYIIYSCDTPDGTYVSVDYVDTNSWTNAEASAKKFYKVEASTEAVPE